MESTLEQKLDESIVKQHISVTNLCTTLGLSPRWVQQRIENGDFVAVRTATDGNGKGKMLIEVASVNQYLKNNRVNPKALLKKSA